MRRNDGVCVVTLEINQKGSKPALLLVFDRRPSPVELGDALLTYHRKTGLPDVVALRLSKLLKADWDWEEVDDFFQTFDTDEEGDLDEEDPKKIWARCGLMVTAKHCDLQNLPSQDKTDC